MKKIILVLTIAVMLTNCGSETQNDASATEIESVQVKGSFFGEEIDESGAVSLDEFVSKMENADTLRVKVKATIDEVCQAKGCWMDVAIGEDDYFTVKFQDYGFFVPKDAGGKETVFEGIAFWDTVSVEELKHYAADAEESDSVINAITEPEISIGFIANGVIIKDNE